MKLALFVSPIIFSLSSSRDAIAQVNAPKKQPSTTAKAPAPVSIEGDVYLVTKSGDIKKAAANSVRLIRLSPDLLTKIDDGCTKITDYTKQFLRDKRLFALDSEVAVGLLSHGVPSARATEALPGALMAIARDSTRLLGEIATIESNLGAETIATSPTGVNAHYRFSTVAPGRYLLFASTQIGGAYYQWLTSVSAIEGQPLVRDLDNSVLNDSLFYCLKR